MFWGDDLIEVALFRISRSLGCDLIEATLFRTCRSLIIEFAEDRDDNDNEEPPLAALMDDPIRGIPIVCLWKAPSLNGMWGYDDVKFLCRHTLTNVPMHMIMQIPFITTIFSF